MGGIFSERVFKAGLMWNQIKKDRIFGYDPFFEATTGFEPVIKVLQTYALPLGYVAIR